jgi:hypothetical protein
MYATLWSMQTTTHAPHLQQRVALAHLHVQQDTLRLEHLTALRLFVKRMATTLQLQTLAISAAQPTIAMEARFTGCLAPTTARVPHQPQLVALARQHVQQDTLQLEHLTASILFVRRMATTLQLRTLAILAAQPTIAMEAISVVCLALTTARAVWLQQVVHAHQCA